MRKDYYEYIREELTAWKESGKIIDSSINLIPEFIKLLTDILDHEEVDRQGRFLINSALGYFVAPDDVLPDDVYGTEGYMDDLFICSIVLTKLYEFYPELMKQVWSNNDNNDFPLGIEISKAYDVSSAYIKSHDLTDKILRYSGLQD